MPLLCYFFVVRLGRGSDLAVESLAENRSDMPCGFSTFLLKCSPFTLATGVFSKHFRVFFS